MSTDSLAAVGAFLSGVASVITASWYVRRTRKRSEEDCDKRLAEYDRALHEGVKLARDEKTPPL